MKNRTVIALRGIGQSGKTTTIGLVFDLLSSAPHVQVERKEALKNGDFYAVLLLADKVRVGITSGGDEPKKVKDSLANLRSLDCSVIVCATRSRGGTVDAVLDLHPPFEIEWVEQVAYHDPGRREQGNMAKAAFIVQRVRAAANLSGGIV